MMSSAAASRKNGTSIRLWKPVLALSGLLLSERLALTEGLRGSSSSAPPDDGRSQETESSWETRCFQTTQELRDAVQRYQGWDVYDRALAQAYGWPIGRWCVSNIYDFSNLFQNWHRDHPRQAQFNEPLGDWDMSLASDVSGMFQNCHDFSQDLSQWDVAEVTTMSRMFASAKNFDQDLGAWDTSQVQDMSYMFWHAHAFRGIHHLNGWDIRSLRTTEAMFRDARSVDSTQLKWDFSDNIVSNTHRIFSDIPGVRMASANIVPQNDTAPMTLPPPHGARLRLRDHHSGMRIDPVAVSSLLHSRLEQQI